LGVHAETLYTLLWRDYCDWYLEAVKPTLAKSPAQQAVLRSVLDAILRLLHPVAPFVTEAVFEGLAKLPNPEVPGLSLTRSRRGGLLCTAGWPDVAGDYRDAEAEEAWGRVQGLVSAIREVRAQHQVKPRQRITLHTAGDAHAAVGRVVESAQAVVEFLAGVEAYTSDEPTGPAVDVRIEGFDCKLSNLADEVDLGAECERLTREIADKDKAIKALEGRLSNPGYTQKAPAHLVEQTRKQLEQAKAERDALQANAEKLGC
ncbi:MAG: class I tRNA ligase family protein, partial [Planctomycetota bacterium]